jgi:hypothetical protein
MGKHENLTGAQRAARYRATKRALGLRLKQFWLPDLRDPAVRDAIGREADEINRRDRAAGVMAEIEAMGEDLLASLPPYGDQPDAG